MIPRKEKKQIVVNPFLQMTITIIDMITYYESVSSYKKVKDKVQYKMYRLERTKKNKEILFSTYTLENDDRNAEGEHLDLYYC